MSTFAERLHTARKAKGLTQRSIAEAFGIARVSVTQWESGQSLPETPRIPPLAKMLGVSVEWLMDGVGNGGPDPSINVQPRIIPGKQLVGARDFPIYAAAQGGDGFMIVHSDVMEYVKRPVILEGVPDSYGILVVGESMVPAYRPGDMALVHPRRPLERDSDVVLFDHDHRTGDAKAMIKRLLNFNDRTLKLEQYNPPKSFTEHRADWPTCHLVVGKYNGR